MRNSVGFAGLLASAVAVSGCVFAPAATIPQRLQQMVNEKYAAFQNGGPLPENAGILVYLVTPRGRWVSTAGLPVGANENWHYRIASVSKTFTAAAIMLLDQQGKLKIDDVVTANVPGTSVSYLPDSPTYAIPYKNQITIRELLSHRAGIFDVFNTVIPESAPSAYAGNKYQAYVTEKLNEPDHQFTLDELAQVLSVNQLSTAPPDTEFRYSDTGYSLLAKIIERVSGKSYDRYLADNFYAPMGLKQTTAPWSGVDVTLPALYFTGYSNDGSGFFPTVEDNMSGQVGPGNIISTPAEMAVWIRTLLSGRGPLTPEQIGRMMTVPAGNTTYALGLGSTELGVGHTGAHPGYVNLVVYNPNDDVAVVVVTPFIDYTRLKEHLALLVDVGREARAIAGYTGTWKPRQAGSAR